MKAVRLLLAMALLAGCNPRPQADSLVSKVLFTANGSYDASADSRTRQGKGIRRVQWRKHPPLAAQEVTVDYDSDARPLAWTMTIEQPGFGPRALAGNDGRQVQTSRGAGLLVESGDLKETLILGNTRQLRLYSRGYVMQHAPELLPAYQH